MSTKWLSLIAALTFFSALWLPRPSDAGSVYGTWSGVETGYAQEYLNGHFLGTTYLSPMPATLYISYDPSQPFVDVDINSKFSVDMSGISITGAPIDFGPESASGSIFGGYGYYGLSPVANYFVNYESILPDGMLVTGGDSAVADITYLNLDGNRTGGVLFFSFQTVPEPSSIVPAASAVLMIVIFAWTRSCRPRPRRRLS